MSSPSKPITPKRVALMVAGLLVLTVLTIHRLSQDESIGKDGAETFSGPTMGAVYTVKLVPPDGPLSDEERAQVATAIAEALENVDAKMSTYRDDSELSRFNAHASTEPFPVSAETLHVFRVAIEISEETDGAFDLTVGPLVNAWGFGPEGQGKAPTDEAIAELIAHTGYEKIAVDEASGALRKNDPAVYCDLSAIAKGFGVDGVAEVLDRLGYHGYMVEVGGEVRTSGLNAAGLPWRIGIEEPVEGLRAVHTVVPMMDMAMATSGDYRNFYQAGGVRVAHTIDPRTGRPVDHRLASVTVFHALCIRADAYATALMVMGPEAGPRFAEEKGLAAVFLIREEKGLLRELRTTVFEFLFPQENDEGLPRPRTMQN